MDSQQNPVARLPNTYMRQFFSYLGSDPELLQKTEETPDSLACLGGDNTFRDYCRFFENARTLTRRADIGLILGRINQLANMHGPVSTALYQSADIKDSIRLLEKFTPLRLPAVSTRWCEDPVHIGLEIEFTESVGGIHPSVTETLLLSISSIITALSQGAVKLARIDLDYPPPAYAPAYREAFGIPSIKFSRQSIRVLVARSDADFELDVDHDPRVRELAIERCEQLLEGTASTRSASEKVQQLFSDNPGHLWRLEEIARHLNMSERTLQRRLSGEGRSYQQLLNDWLKHEARKLLVEEHLTIENVAMLLGYSEVSNFRQACRRWYNCSPLSLRDQLRA